LSLGLLFGIFYSLKEIKKRKIDPNLFLDAVFYIIIGLIIGSRLGHVLQNLNYYIQNPVNVLKLWQGGLTFHGGLAGAFLGAFVFVKLKKITWQTFLLGTDAVALSAPLGIAIGRIGCSLINDHQGAETFLAWGIIWPDKVVRHPVAEYLIIANLLIFIILKYLFPKLTRLNAIRPGMLMAGFLFLYSVSRFFLDFTRSVGTPLSDPRYFSLTAAQWFSLAVIGITIIVFQKKIRNAMRR